MRGSVKNYCLLLWFPQSLKNTWDTVPHRRTAAGHTWDSSAVWTPCLPGCGMGERAEGTNACEGKKERKRRSGAKGNHIIGSHDIISSPENWGPWILSPTSLFSSGGVTSPHQVNADTLVRAGEPVCYVCGDFLIKPVLTHLTDKETEAVGECW